MYLKYGYLDQVKMKSQTETQKGSFKGSISYHIYRHIILMISITIYHSRGQQGDPQLFLQLIQLEPDQDRPTSEQNIEEQDPG